MKNCFNNEIDMQHEKLGGKQIIPPTGNLWPCYQTNDIIIQ
jgi:hypothetical protein